MSENSNFITPPTHSFAGLPVCTQLKDLEADIAIIGLHYVSPYPPRLTTTATQSAVETAPDAIRLQSSIFKDHFDHYDFDFNDVLLPNRQVRIVDCGDIDKQANGGMQNPERITAAIRTILGRGAMPIALGTDEGGFIPFVRAYDGYDALCVVHMDAHIDWRNERSGVREGYSSVMRRASEMPWVKAMAQVGLRGVGSARQQEIDDALTFGSVFIRAREVHRKGIDACIDKIPAADHYLITIDADALDTAIAPGVLFTSPGGLTFDETTDLVRRIASKGQIAGICLFEVRPERDINGLTASTGAQLIINFIGTMARSSRIGG
jgi:agmatinase